MPSTPSRESMPAFDPERKVPELRKFSIKVSKRKSERKGAAHGCGGGVLCTIAQCVPGPARRRDSEASAPSSTRGLSPLS